MADQGDNASNGQGGTGDGSASSLPPEVLAAMIERANDSSEVLDWALKEYLAATIQSKHIMNYNGANLFFNHAANTANKLGLSDEQKAKITPFPCPTNVSVASTERQQALQDSTGWIPKAGKVALGLSAALGLPFAGIGLALISGLASLPGAEPEPEPEPQTQVIQQSFEPGEVGVILK